MSPELKAAVERVQAEHGHGGLRGASAKLSAHYRAGGRSDAAIDLGAYLTVRLPATFAAVERVLREVAERRPGFAPRSMIDAGAGPGTASWAAVSAWPAIEAVTLADNNPQFLGLAGRIAEQSPHPALSAARRRQADMAALDAGDGADLVIAAYALAEIPEARQRVAVEALWRTAANMLVLVEPGTPAGFARIRRARDMLIAAGAIPVAPCPHAGACPMTGEDWCHFAVRLARSRAHMHAKQASVPFEDEKFSWLAVSRTGEASGGGRILSPPVEQKPGIGFRLCTPGGLEQRQIARRDRDAYKAHRRRAWGDLI
jgi:ribosomal protein RSM22 (predicted rRNA methylase)